MNTALVCGLIILVVLAVLLLAGVPIAVALGISSVCAILPVMDAGVAVLTGHKGYFLVFLYLAFGNTVFYPCRKSYE